MGKNRKTFCGGFFSARDTLFYTHAEQIIAG